MPLLTTAVPSNPQGVGAEPQVTEVGARAAWFSSVWVVPFGFGVVSSASSRPMPFVRLSPLAVAPAGRMVNVWNPWLMNWRSDPVGTETVRGKKSLKAHR